MIKSLFKAFDFFQIENFLLCREKDILQQLAMVNSKNLSSKSLKNTCKGVDFLLSFMLGIYSFTKNEVIHGYSSRILAAPSAGCFTDSQFQVPSFVKHILWHKNYFLEGTSPHF